MREIIIIILSVIIAIIFNIALIYYWTEGNNDIKFFYL